MTNNDKPNDSQWDAEWTRVFEMDMESPEMLPYAKQIVNAEMERIGNEVERPLVMKIRVQAVSGTINRDRVGEFGEEE